MVVAIFGIVAQTKRDIKHTSWGLGHTRPIIQPGKAAAPRLRPFQLLSLAAAQGFPSLLGGVSHAQTMCSRSTCMARVTFAFGEAVWCL